MPVGGLVLGSEMINKEFELFVAVRQTSAYDISKNVAQVGPVTSELESSVLVLA